MTLFVRSMRLSGLLGLHEIPNHLMFTLLQLLDRALLQQAALIQKSESIGDTHYSVEEVISLTFPVELSPDDNGTFLATFPDVPGAVTFGDDEEQALVHAVDVLETMLLARILDRREIPAPSSANGSPVIRKHTIIYTGQ